MLVLFLLILFFTGFSSWTRGNGGETGQYFIGQMEIQLKAGTA